MKDPRFTTERERRFYKVHWVLIWLMGAATVAVGVSRLFLVGDKVACAIILTGIYLPLHHKFYEICGVWIGRTGAEMYDRFRRRQ